MNTYSGLCKAVVIISTSVFLLLYLSATAVQFPVPREGIPTISGRGEILPKSEGKSAAMKFDSKCLLLDSNVEIETISIPESVQLQNFSSHDLSCLYNRYVTSLQTLCKQHIFLGDPRKGGVNYCADYDPLPDSIVYFFQSELPAFGDLIPELVKRFHFKVNYFYWDEQFPNATLLNNKGIGGVIVQHEIESNSSTLSHWMDRLAHHELEMLPLVVTENNLPAIESIIHSDTVRRIRILILRLHYAVNTYTKDGLIRQLAHLRLLYEKGFRIYWFDKRFECQTRQRELNHCYIVCLIRLDYKYEKWKMSASTTFTLPSSMAISSMGAGTVAELCQVYMSTIQFHCRQFVRIGTTTDGGWEVCLDKQYRPRQPCLVYSFGIDNNWSFDEEIAPTWNCEVLSFDPSIGKPNHTHSPGVSFYNFGIGANDARVTGAIKKNGNAGSGLWTVRTLKTLLTDFGHLNRRIDVLKMDIEFSEWAVIPNIISTGALKNVAQLLIEFHLDKDGGSASKVKVIKMLYDYGFMIFWIHKNPACRGSQTFNATTVFTCHEICFVNIRNEIS